MPFAHLSGLDLNLLLPLQAILEERHITRAAERCNLSQPAMSRALVRLRETLGDDLVVRTGRGYERTPRGERLLEELESLLPRLDAMMRGEAFDPSQTQERFRVTGTDHAATVLLPSVVAAFRRTAPRALLEVVAWSEDGYLRVEAGACDLALGVASAPIPPPSLRVEVLYEEAFVCLVAQESPVGDSLTLAEYLRYPHAAVSTAAGQQTMIDRPLGDRARRRQVVFRSPYFLPTAGAIAGTDLILTLPRHLGERLMTVAGVRLVEAPPEIAPFPYAMAWHPRLDNDPAQAWFRSQIRLAASSLRPSVSP